MKRDKLFIKKKDKWDNKYRFIISKRDRDNIMIHKDYIK
jgi:hypothetical protein